MDITSAAFLTIISASTSSGVSLLIANSNKRRSLDDKIDRIIKITVQYTYLQSSNL